MKRLSYMKMFWLSSVPEAEPVFFTSGTHIDFVLKNLKMFGMDQDKGYPRRAQQSELAAMFPVLQRGWIRGSYQPGLMAFQTFVINNETLGRLQDYLMSADYYNEKDQFLWADGNESNLIETTIGDVLTASGVGDFRKRGGKDYSYSNYWVKPDGEVIPLGIDPHFLYLQEHSEELFGKSLKDLEKKYTKEHGDTSLFVDSLYERNMNNGWLRMIVDKAGVYVDIRLRTYEGLGLLQDAIYKIFGSNFDLRKSIFIQFKEWGEVIETTLEDLMTASSWSDLPGWGRAMRGGIQLVNYWIMPNGKVEKVPSTEMHVDWLRNNSEKVFGKSEKELEEEFGDPSWGKFLDHLMMSALKKGMVRVSISSNYAVFDTDSKLQENLYRIQDAVSALLIDANPETMIRISFLNLIETSKINRLLWNRQDIVTTLGDLMSVSSFDELEESKMGSAIKVGDVSKDVELLHGVEIGDELYTAFSPVCVSDIDLEHGLVVVEFPDGSLDTFSASDVAQGRLTIAHVEKVSGKKEIDEAWWAPESLSLDMFDRIQRLIDMGLGNSVRDILSAIPGIGESEIRYYEKKMEVPKAPIKKEPMLLENKPKEEKSFYQKWEDIIKNMDLGPGKPDWEDDSKEGGKTAMKEYVKLNKDVTSLYSGQEGFKGEVGDVIVYDGNRDLYVVRFPADDPKSTRTLSLMRTDFDYVDDIGGGRKGTAPKVIFVVDERVEGDQVLVGVYENEHAANDYAMVRSDPEISGHEAFVRKVTDPEMISDYIELIELMNLATDMRKEPVLRIGEKLPTRPEYGSLGENPWECDCGYEHPESVLVSPCCTMENHHLSKGGKVKRLSKDKIPGGKADGLDESEFPSKALDRGKEVELEHTDDLEIAKEIAKDHLVESDEYYEYLDEMEEEMKEKRSRTAAVRFRNVPQESKSSKEKIAIMDGIEIGKISGRYDFVKAKQTDRIRTKMAWRWSYSIDTDTLGQLLGTPVMSMSRWKDPDPNQVTITTSGYDFSAESDARGSMLEQINSAIDQASKILLKPEKEPMTLQEPVVEVQETVEEYEGTSMPDYEVREGREKVIDWIWAKAKKALGMEATEKEIRAEYNRLLNKMKETPDGLYAGKKRSFAEGEWAKSPIGDVVVLELDEQSALVYSYANDTTHEFSIDQLEPSEKTGRPKYFKRHAKEIQEEVDQYKKWLETLSEDQITSMLDSKAGELQNTVNKIKAMEIEIDKMKNEHKQHLAFFSYASNKLGKELLETENYITKIKKWAQSKSVSWKAVATWLMDRVDTDLRKQAEDLAESMKEVETRIRIDVVPKETKEVSADEHYARCYIRDEIQNKKARKVIWSGLRRCYSDVLSVERLHEIMSEYYSKKGESAIDKARKYVKDLWDTAMSIVSSLSEHNKEFAQLMTKE